MLKKLKNLLQGNNFKAAIANPAVSTILSRASDFVGIQVFEDHPDVSEREDISNCVSLFSEVCASKYGFQNGTPLGRWFMFSVWSAGFETALPKQGVEKIFKVLKYSSFQFLASFYASVEQFSPALVKSCTLEELYALLKENADLLRWLSRKSVLENCKDFFTFSEIFCSEVEGSIII